MIVLGISSLDKDSSVVIFQDNKPVFAVSEERLTRRKQESGFPFLAIDDALAYTGLSLEEIDAVAYPFFNAQRELAVTLRGVPSMLADSFLEHRGKHILRDVGDFLKGISSNYKVHKWCDRQLSLGLSKLGLESRLQRFDHELCHAAAAAFSSGYKQALVLVSDWYGSGASGGIYRLADGDLQPLLKYNWPNSLGGWYACFTEQLGYVSDREEGKVLGLSAYGDPSAAFKDILSEFRLMSDGSFRHRRPVDASWVGDFVKSFDKSDVAAGVQAVFEVILIASLTSLVSRIGKTDLCLAGGSLANVKLNQRLSNIEGIERTFVFPNMGDGGTGYGAATLALANANVSNFHRLTNVFLSADYPTFKVAKAIKDYQLVAFRPDNIEQEVARRLASNKIVATWTGRMEFGPRALGNRSILANPSNPLVANRLNEKLGRDPIMPFAPVTTLELAEKMNIPNLSRSLDCARFMTTTYDLPSEVSEKIPAAVHIDGSARLQVIRSDENPSLHRVISEFYRLTNVPAVLNTSFNLHNEPIVYSPDHAIKTFLSANLDSIRLGPFIIDASI